MDLWIPIERRKLSIRTVPWPDVYQRRDSECGDWLRPTSAAQVSRASMGIVHHVPPPLRQVGCMWLDEGDEARRCGKPVCWMVGACLDLPRLYCEEHGQLIWEKKHPQPQRHAG